MNLLFLSASPSSLTIPLWMFNNMMNTIFYKQGHFLLSISSLLVVPLKSEVVVYSNSTSTHCTLQVCFSEKRINGEVTAVGVVGGRAHPQVTHCPPPVHSGTFCVCHRLLSAFTSSDLPPAPLCKLHPLLLPLPSTSHLSMYIFVFEYVNFLFIAYFFYSFILSLQISCARRNQVI